MPEGAETVDLTGKTIIPGLVNLHVHYREGPEESSGSSGRSSTTA